MNQQQYQEQKIKRYIYNVQRDQCPTCHKGLIKIKDTTLTGNCLQYCDSCSWYRYF